VTGMDHGIGFVAACADRLVDEDAQLWCKASFHGRSGIRGKRLTRKEGSNT